MLFAHRVRTSIVISAAGAALVAALLLTPRQPGCPTASAGDLDLTARLVSTRILAGTTDQDLAVTITAHPGTRHARPPVSLAIVIDRSGSMGGEPITNAKAAADHLIDQLGDTDAFTVVTYSSGDELVVPIRAATAANKAAAHAAVKSIYDDGGTCISCGLGRGAGELAATPVHGGLRRIVLISDGQANEGVYDRDELTQLASDIAARGNSISAVGVGLDFDELTMQRLASVGHGNYYFVEDTKNLDTMFERELGGLAETIASDVVLAIAPAPGVEIVEAYGYPMQAAPGREPRVVVPIADLRAGETRKVVIHARVTRDQRTADLGIAGVGLRWHRLPDGSGQSASVQVDAQVTIDPAAVEASTDRETLQLVEQARSAQVLEEATSVYQTQGAQAAQRVIEHHMRAVHANKHLDPDTARMIEQAESQAADGFAAAPSGGTAATKAVKATRAKAYELAR